MRERRVVLLDAAELDLNDIADWVGEFASDATTARYVDGIYGHLAKLGYASERGTIRDDASGMRRIGILRGVTVAFVVEPDRVVIHRVLYHGRSIGPVRETSDQDDYME